MESTLGLCRRLHSKKKNGGNYPLFFFNADLSNQGINSYAGSVRNSTNSSDSESCSNIFAACSYFPAFQPASPTYARTFTNSSGTSEDTSSFVTLRPSSSLPFDERIHCQICEREISAVAASSIRLKIGTQPLPP